MAKLHIIYIPGIGDHRSRVQPRAAKAWRWNGVASEYFPVVWNEGDWKAKQQRLLQRIDVIHAAGKNVALVGASAGATAVINTYALRKDVLVGAVLIAGKVHRPEAIGQSYHRKTSAFVESAYACQGALASLTADDRSRIMSRYALYDETVWTHDSNIEGARNKTVFSIGHVFTIASQITLAAPIWIRWLKRKQN